MAFLSTLPDERVLTVAYEQFVQRPQAELQRVFGFVGVNHVVSTLDVEAVRASSVGAGHRAFSDDQLGRLTSLTHTQLGRFGYV